MTTVSNTTPMVDVHAQLHNSDQANIAALRVTVDDHEKRLQEQEDRQMTPGPQGEKGDRGAAGSTGPRGPAGQMGPQGAAGQDAVGSLPRGTEDRQALVWDEDGNRWVPGDPSGSGVPEGMAPGLFLAGTADGKGTWATVGGVTQPTSLAVGTTVVRPAPHFPVNLDDQVPAATTPSMLDGYATLAPVAVLPEAWQGEAAGSLLIGSTLDQGSATVYAVNPGVSGPTAHSLPATVTDFRAYGSLTAGRGVVVAALHLASSGARPVWATSTTVTCYPTAVRTDGTVAPLRFGTSAGTARSGSTVTVDLAGERCWAVVGDALNVAPSGSYLWVLTAYLAPGDSVWTWNDFGLIALLGGLPTSNTRPSVAIPHWLKAGGGHLWLRVAGRLFHKPDDTTTDWVEWLPVSRPSPPYNPELVDVDVDGALRWAAPGSTPAAVVGKTAVGSVEIRSIAPDGTYAMVETSIPRYIEDGSFVAYNTTYATSTFPASFGCLGGGKYAVGGPMALSQFDASVVRNTDADKARPAVWVTTLNPNAPSTLVFDGAGMESRTSLVAGVNNPLQMNTPAVVHTSGGSSVNTRYAGGQTGVAAIRRRAGSAPGRVGLVALVHRQHPTAAGVYVREAIAAEVEV